MAIHLLGAAMVAALLLKGVLFSQDNPPKRVKVTPSEGSQKIGVTYEYLDAISAFARIDDKIKDLTESMCTSMTLQKNTFVESGIDEYAANALKKILRQDEDADGKNWRNPTEFYQNDAHLYDNRNHKILAAIESVYDLSTQETTQRIVGFVIAQFNVVNFDQTYYLSPNMDSIFELDEQDELVSVPMPLFTDEDQEIKEFFKILINEGDILNSLLSVDFPSGETNYLKDWHGLVFSRQYKRDEWTNLKRVIRRVLNRALIAIRANSFKWSSLDDQEGVPSETKQSQLYDLSTGIYNILTNEDEGMYSFGPGYGVITDGQILDFMEANYPNDMSTDEDNAEEEDFKFLMQTIARNLAKYLSSEHQHESKGGNPDEEPYRVDYRWQNWRNPTRKPVGTGEDEESIPGEIYIAAVCVHPHYSKGKNDPDFDKYPNIRVAKDMIEHILDDASEQYYADVSLMTGQENLVGYYERYGFRRVTDEDQDIFPHYYEPSVMQRVTRGTGSSQLRQNRIKSEALTAMNKDGTLVWRPNNVDRGELIMVRPYKPADSMNIDRKYRGI